jgi:hypothetical protein
LGRWVYGTFRGRLNAHRGIVTSDDTVRNRNLSFRCRAACKINKCFPVVITVGNPEDVPWLGTQRWNVWKTIRIIAGGWLTLARV